MPGTATTYWSDTIVDATPDHTAPITIAQLTDVAANTYGQHVSVMATVSIETAQDTTALQFELSLNGPSGDDIGSEYEIEVTDTGSNGTYSFLFTGQLPLGTHTLALHVSQLNATTDSIVSAVTIVGFVGD